MNLNELFQVAIKNKQGGYTTSGVDRTDIYHNTYKPSMVIDMGDRRYVVGRNGNFVRVPDDT